MIRWIPARAARRLAAGFAMLLALAGAARADLATSRGRARLYAKPSSSSKVLDHAESGVQLPVLDRSPNGRYLQVMVGEKIGWVRAADVEVQVEATEEPAAPATTSPDESGDRKKSPPPGDDNTPEVKAAEPAETPAAGEAAPLKKGAWAAVAGEGAGAGPLVVTAAEAELLERPREGATRVGTARSGERLFGARKSRDDRFHLVELPGARVAWIDAAAVAAAPSEPAAPRPPPRAARAGSASTGKAPPETPPAAARNERAALRDDRDVPARPTRGRATRAAAAATVTAAPPPPLNRFQLRAGAGFALGQLDQLFTSNAGGPLTNYGLRTGLAGAEVLLGFDGGTRPGAGFFGGVAGSYRFGGAAEVGATASGLAVTLGVRTHDVEGLVRFGYRARVLGGLRIAAQIGGRLMMALVDQDYLVPVPSERIAALSIGASVEVPRIVGGLGLAFAFAGLPIGQRVQTENLGEGEDAGTSGLGVALTLSYEIARGAGLFVAGRWSRAGTRFTGTADRDPAITAAERTTTLSALTFGLRYTR